MTEIYLINLLLGVAGVLATAVAVLVYRRLGRIEDSIQRAIDLFRQESQILHTRVTRLDSRLVRVETRMGLPDIRA